MEIRNLDLERNSADDSTFYQGIAVYANNVTMSNLTISNNVSAGSEYGAGIWIGTGDYDPHSDNIAAPSVNVDTIDIDNDTLSNISDFANDAVQYNGDAIENYNSGE
ncbi:hypothetical protein SAMN04488054_11854 [Salibacterium qingdaonense]|uniref:Uncharacterized protein n=1 Tax=Salibacterium qingdaonense TaxID=266892 RepID=A0A1I4NKM2_9BACI|nr:hypothetical protein SAMN04488054_11854 [Salibacterium qingdaonense]